MLPNVPAMYEAHFGVPMTGAVLNTLNTCLDAEAIAFMLQHGEARVLLTDREFSSVIEKALAMLPGARPLVIEVDDPSYVGGKALGEIEYEAFIAWPAIPNTTSSCRLTSGDAIALNYTSGTTGNPKGVVSHHRGASLNATSNIVSWAMPHHAIHPRTLPMFHCNGRCFPWTMAANAGTNVCLRRVDVQTIFDQIREHRVDHFCGAPIVHNMLINALDAMRAGIAHTVTALARWCQRRQLP